jgi:glycosyltransferase involved in cell wall biosynthesis
VPTLATCHGVPDDDYARAARVFRLAGGPVVACGPGVAAALGEHGVQAVSTVVNGVAAAPPPAERSAVERDYDVPPGAALLLCVGRLAPQKNHALAVRALADLPGAHLVILGDGPLRAELGRLATRLHVEDRLRLAGVRPDARAVMAAADVVLLPSRWEGLPLVALEALLSGTPLVATAGRGVRELLRDDVDALLVPVDDAAALAAGVRRVLTEPGLAQRLGESGRAAAASYTEARMVRDYLDLYAGLVR